MRRYVIDQSQGKAGVQCNCADVAGVAENQSSDLRGKIEICSYDHSLKPTRGVERYRSGHTEGMDNTGTWQACDDVLKHR